VHVTARLPVAVTVGNVAYGPYGSPYGDDPSRVPLPPMPSGWQPQGPFPVPSPMTPQAGLNPASAIPYPGLPPASAVPAYGPPQYGYGLPGQVEVDPLSGEYLSAKSKVIAGVLQLVLGAFGVGRFYTGHIGLAIGQIAVGWGIFILFVCAGFLLILPWMFVWIGFLWPLIDGIVLLAGRPRDSNGYLLRS
jgi:TM2 domain-containing membrane protein YozV